MVRDGVGQGEGCRTVADHVRNFTAHARALVSQQVRIKVGVARPRVKDVRIFAVEPLGQFLEHAFAHDGVHRSGDRVEIVAVSHGERFDGLAKRGPRVDAASFRIVREFVGVPVPDAGFETIHAVPVEWFRRRIRG